MGGAAEPLLGDPAPLDEAQAKRNGRMKIVIISYIILIATTNMGGTLFAPTIITDILAHNHPDWDDDKVISRASTYKSFLDAFNAVVGFLTLPTIGALSDVYGRKKMLLLTGAGYALYMASLLIAYVSNSIGLVYVSSLFSFSGGAQVCAIAFMSDVSTDAKDKGKNFGFVLAAFIIGTIGASLALGYLSKYGMVFVCVLLLCLSGVGVVYLFFFFREETPFYKTRYERKFNFVKGNPVQSLRLLFVISPYVTVLVVSHFLLHMAIANQLTVGVLYAQHRYNWGSKEYGISMAISAASSMVWQTLGVIVLQKRFKQGTLLVSTYILAVVIQFIQAIASKGWLFIAVGAIGGYMSLAFPLVQALVSKNIPSEKQGIAFGGFSSLSSIASLVGALIDENMFALCLKGDGYFTCPGTPFFIGSFLFLINSVMCAILFFKYPQAEKGEPKNEKKEKNSREEEEMPILEDRENNSVPLVDADL